MFIVIGSCVSSVAPFNSLLLFTRLLSQGFLSCTTSNHQEFGFSLKKLLRYIEARHLGAISHLLVGRNCGMLTILHARSCQWLEKNKAIIYNSIVTFSNNSKTHLGLIVFGSVLSNADFVDLGQTLEPGYFQCFMFEIFLTLGRGRLQVRGKKITKGKIYVFP